MKILDGATGSRIDETEATTPLGPPYLRREVRQTRSCALIEDRNGLPFGDSVVVPRAGDNCGTAPRSFVLDGVHL